MFGAARASTGASGEKPFTNDGVDGGGAARLAERWKKRSRAWTARCGPAYLKSELVLTHSPSWPRALHLACASARASRARHARAFGRLVDLSRGVGTTRFRQALREEAAGRALLSLARCSAVPRRALPRCHQRRRRPLARARPMAPSNAHAGRAQSLGRRPTRSPRKLLAIRTRSSFARFSLSQASRRRRRAPRRRAVPAVRKCWPRLRAARGASRARFRMAPCSIPTVPRSSIPCSRFWSARVRQVVEAAFLYRHCAQPPMSCSLAARRCARPAVRPSFNDANRKGPFEAPEETRSSSPR